MTSEAPPWLRSEPGAVTLELLVQPRASRDRIVGLHEGRLKIQLSAPPVDGAANAALVAFLAALLGLPRRCVVLLRGETGRRKSVRIEGAEAARVVAAVVGSTGRKA